MSTEAAWKEALAEEMRQYDDLMRALHERDRDPSDIRVRTAQLAWRRWEEAKEKKTAVLLAWKNPKQGA